MNNMSQLTYLVGAHNFKDNNKFKVYTDRQLDKIPQLTKLPEEAVFGIKVVAQVLPFRVNQYVIDELIDWDNWQQDPIFRLTFPQKEMLDKKDFSLIADHLKNKNRTGLNTEVERIRKIMNPNPDGQMELNVPAFNGKKLKGIQHKYRETILFFPSQGQTCHSYCTFCFRWSQFIGDKELKFSSNDIESVCSYLIKHPDVTDVILTGGDPMVMNADHFEKYIDALLKPELEHVQTIRIGTKSLSYWPHRFVTDDDAEDLLRIFEKVINSGKHLAFMAHYDHWKEIDTDMAVNAIKRVRSTGAVIRSQGPLIAKINDDADQWAKMWKIQVNNGIIPYYMFVERDTGARQYFEVPLYRALQIYRDAMKQVSGIARTARGPVMSTKPGKVEVQGVTEINNEKVFVLRFIQCRDPDMVERPFFAQYDEKATWLDDLKPAFGEDKFFFQSSQ